MTATISPEKLAEINHPVHGDYFEVNNRPLQGENWERVIDGLLRRFEVPKDFESNDPKLVEEHGIKVMEVRTIGDALAIGAYRTNAYRQIHEAVNTGRLISRTEHERMLTPQRKPYIPDTIRTYRELAGHRATLPQYISWFGEAALTAFGHTSTYGSFDSICLELGGVGEVGNSNNTKELDEIMQALPSRIHALGRGAKVTSPLSDQVHHSFIPMWEDDGKRYNFNFAMIRRREPLFDVLASTRTRVFRQKIGLIVLRHLPEDDRIAFEEAYAAHTLPDESRKEAHDQAAMAGGMAYERSISQGDNSKEYISVSTQYLGKNRRPVGKSRAYQQR